MDPRTQERVERWESRPYDGGDDLESLGDGEFSGAVAAGGAWLFMLNGRVVGVVDGSLETVRAAASGTVYDAPDPALPLLCSMTARGGDTRAKYYTNETPISEVDEKLQSASFTGYIELSEQVLSGDYYVVYYGGRRMPAAYIGSAERLITGDEAFERADDEVGIYEVVDVDVDVTDVGDDRTADAAGPPTGQTSDGADLPSGRGATEGDSSSVDRDGSTGEHRPGSESADRTGSDGPAADGVTADAARDAAARSETRDEAGASSNRSSDRTGRTTATSVDDEPAGRASDAGDDAASDQSAGSRVADAATESGATEPDPSAERGGSGDADVDSADGTGRSPGTAAGADAGAGTGADAGADDRDDEGAVDRDDEGAGDGAGAGGDVAGAGADEGITTTGEPAADRTTPGITDSDGATDRDSAGRSEGGTESTRDRSRTESATGTSDGSSPAETASVGMDAEADVDGDVDAADRAEGDADATADRVDGDRDATADRTDRGSDPDAADADEDSPERFEEEARWRETRRIPSIDPDATAAAEDAGRSRTRPDPSRSRGEGTRSTGSTGRAGTEETASRDATEPESAAPGGTESSDDVEVTADPESIAESADAGRSSDEDALRSDMLEREDKIDQLTQQVAELEARRDELRAEYDDVAAERDRLQAETQDLSATVERLEARIQDLEAELEQARAASAGAGTPADGTAAEAGGAGPTAGAAGGGTQLSPQEALDGTNVFVRYESKSKPTLESAHDGDADRSEVAANLRLERHTQFDAEDAVVAGQPYEEFLEGTMEYRFVEWLVTTLPYEIRDTGRSSGLADVYDVIPHIDRAELSASIPLEDDDEAVPEQVRFDVVAFDKMGAPLLVATLNDAREPATREMLETLEESASSVKASYPDLGGAFAVTSSFFEPGALEVAEEATDSGFLNRGSKLSYVNLSRKQGYHLSLVESRSGGFHVTVPEL